MYDKLNVLLQEVISREVLVEEGLRQVVELEQAAIWRFLWWSGTISVHVLVDQNREDHSVRTHCCFRWCVCLRNVLQFTDMGGLRNVLLWLHLVGRKHMFTTQTNGYFVENEFSNVQYKENILYLDFLLTKHRTPLPKGFGRKLNEFICMLFSCSCFLKNRLAIFN